MENQKNANSEIKIDIQTIDSLYKQLKELSMGLQKMELESKHREEIRELEDLIFRLENPPKKWWKFWV
jgi:hypothetical protein